MISMTPYSIMFANYFKFLGIQVAGINLLKSKLLGDMLC